MMMEDDMIIYKDKNVQLSIEYRAYMWMQCTIAY